MASSLCGVKLTCEHDTILNGDKEHRLYRNEREKLVHAQFSARSRQMSTYICVRSKNLSSSTLSALRDQDFDVHVFVCECECKVDGDLH